MCVFFLSEINSTEKKTGNDNKFFVIMFFEEMTEQPVEKKKQTNIAKVTKQQSEKGKCLFKH